jgi:hypothetical protein
VPVTERSTQSTVEFGAPFRLPGFDKPLAAGTYTVTTEEEGFEVAGHIAYRRTATTLCVVAGGRTEYHSIDPVALEQALGQDRKRVAIAPEEVPELPDSVLSQRKWPWRSLSKWIGTARFGQRG